MATVFLPSAIAPATPLVPSPQTSSASALASSTRLATAAPTVTPAPVLTRKLYPNYKVIVLNDDFNTFEHVAKTLTQYIPNMTPDEAWKLTNQVHFEGQATVWTGPLEQAELYHSQLTRAGLTMAPLEKA